MHQFNSGILYTFRDSTACFFYDEWPRSQAYAAFMVTKEFWGCPYEVWEKWRLRKQILHANKFNSLILEINDLLCRVIGQEKGSAWLHKPRQELENKSAFEVINDGRLESVLWLLQMLANRCLKY